jgi:hypothetical protein
VAKASAGGKELVRRRPSRAAGPRDVKKVAAKPRLATERAEAFKTGFTEGAAPLVARFN